jgi:uncharacterized protein (DUF58 family)
MKSPAARSWIGCWIRCRCPERAKIQNPSSKIRSRQSSADFGPDCSLEFGIWNLEFYLIVIPKEQIAKIRKLELRTRKLAEEMLSGAYHSVFKGRGLDFEEVRVYAPGDDVRTIDWNVTARTGITHVRRYREERELAFVVMVDVSASGLLGSGAQNKRQLAAEIASLLAFSALRNNDRVALILFSDQIEQFIPLGKGQPHVFRIIKEILYTRPKGSGTRIGAGLTFLNKVFRRRAVVILISDFLDEAYERTLKTTSRRHDLIGIHVYDERERRLPDVGWIRLRDAESGEVLEVNTSNPQTRETFARAAEKRVEKMRALLRRTGTDFIEIPTASNYHLALRRFFDSRAAHRR